MHIAPPLPAFAYSAPTIVWFAPDGLARLGSYLKRLLVSRALVVCDARAERDGVAEKVREAGGGRVGAVWSGVLSDAPLDSVLAGAEEARRSGADGVVAIGGGSSIDSGKAIALLARHGGDPSRWDGANKVDGPGLPLCAIPTTAGTGSEASSIAVVKDAARSRKLVIIDRAVYPAVAILDPRLTAELPPALTAATGIDALTHAIEGVVSTFHQPVCDAIGLECVRLVREHLPRAVAEPGHLGARAHMLIAASMAGQLVSLTYSGVSHAVAHALGIGFGVHHGAANGVALPWSIRLNAEHAPSAAMYARCARAFGLAPQSSGDRAAALELADATELFARELGLPTRLSAFGVAAGDLPHLAELAFADPSHRPNPVKMTSAAALADSLASLV